jgi:LemA protein
MELFVIVLVVVVVWCVMTRNTFVRRVTMVTESWRQIDVELRRRYDLIPNLVSVVNASVRFERAMLEALTELRIYAMTVQDIAVRAGVEDSLDEAVRRTLVRAEAYPQLQASQQFEMLQAQLVEAENRIASSRRLYNGNVRALNSMCGAFPSNLIGALMGVRPAEYFTGEAAASGVRLG